MKIDAKTWTLTGRCKSVMLEATCFADEAFLSNLRDLMIDLHSVGEIVVRRQTKDGEVVSRWSCPGDGKMKIKRTET